jgi:hypothetical protein
MSHNSETQHNETEAAVHVETAEASSVAEHHPQLDVHAEQERTPEEDVSRNSNKQTSLDGLKAGQEEHGPEGRVFSPHASDLKSPSDVDSFKSQDVQLEELSLDDPQPCKSEPASLEKIDIVSEESLTTARPLDANNANSGAGVSSNVTASTSPVTSPTTLDALLSPTKEEFKFPVRESVVSEAATDDDARFSTVLLSARQSLDPAHASLSLGRGLQETLTELPEEAPEDSQEHEHEHDDRRDTLDGNELVRYIHQNRQHKKTASTSTIISANNMPFILHQVESEELGKRASQEGKQKLQEEFVKKHESQVDAEAAVDWGTWLVYVCNVSDLKCVLNRFLGRCCLRCVIALSGLIRQLTYLGHVRLSSLCRCLSHTAREGHRKGNTEDTARYDMAVNVGRTFCAIQ